MRDLYLGGVVDFDRMFGEWVERHEAAAQHQGRIWSNIPECNQHFFEPLNVFIPSSGICHA